MCQVVRVTTARKVINTVYRLHGQVLEIVRSTESLGDISRGLSWNSLMVRITGNANRTLDYIKRKLKKKIKIKTRRWEKQLIIRLSALSWSTLPPFGTPTPRNKAFQLEKLQRRAARSTTSNYDYRSSVTAMLDELGWTTLEEKRAYARLCLFYKIVHGPVAVPLPDYIHITHRVVRYYYSMTFRQISTTRIITSTHIYFGHSIEECFTRVLSQVSVMLDWLG